MSAKTEICNAFNTHAATYEQSAKVQHEIGERLFERLHYLKIKPRYILDLGCGPGIFLQRLKQFYPEAEVIGIDIAYSMLCHAQKRQPSDGFYNLINADMTKLPFSESQFDLIFANQVIHWSIPLQYALQELYRVLSPHGCLMFSTLGPDTFQELRQAFAGADRFAHTNHFMDLHDVGDHLLHEDFLDPVVDREILTAHYGTLSALLSNLKQQGVRNINPSRSRGLTGKHSWGKFKQEMTSLQQTYGQVPLTYEIIYGHAWKGTSRRAEHSSETYIPIAALRASLQGK